MGKIIQINTREWPLKQLTNKNTINDIVDYVSEMNHILHLIENSLENTPNYGTKDLNRRR